MSQKIFIAILLLLFSLVPAIAQEEEKSADNEFISKDRIKYFGDCVIEEDEVVNGDVILMEGDLTVRGVVNGNCVLYLGDAHIFGLVNGDVIALKGDIDIAPEGKVVGEAVESRLLNFSMEFEKRTPVPFKSEFYDNDSHSLLHIDGGGFTNDYGECSNCEEHNVKLGFDKVNGFFLGMVFPKRFYLKGNPVVAFSGAMGYGFGNKRWQFAGELDKRFETKLVAYEFGLEAHKLTDTEDRWIIQDSENSLAAFLLHEDFRDYYYRQGFGAHFSQYFGRSFRLKFKYLVDDYETARNRISWALFGGDKKFAPNYSFLGPGANITEGMMRSGIITGDARFFRGDLLVNGSAEISGDEIGGDFDFKRYIFETRGHFLLDRYEGVDFRLLLGSSDGSLPPQKVFTLGGISTLRGFEHKEFVGNQVALLNFEYRLIDLPGKLHFWPINFVNLGLFTDVGSTHPDIFTDFDTDYFKSDVGFSLLEPDGDSRIDIARRTDTGDKPWVFTLRIAKAF
jgi:hypothetical protein